MKKTLRERIAALAAMNVPALRAEHRKLFGKDSVSSHRQFLFRKIAWRLQADEEGLQPDKIRERPDHDPRLPMPGGWIMKHHKGKTHVVKVLDDGRFEYEDRRYKSLSAIAQEITGTKWNGLLFSGLTETKNGRR